MTRQEGLEERHLGRRPSGAELVVDLLERGHGREVAPGNVVVHHHRNDQDRHRLVEEVQRVGRMVEEHHVAQAQRRGPAPPSTARPSGACPCAIRPRPRELLDQVGADELR